MSGTAWTSDQLERIGDAKELQPAPLGRDGTPRRTVPICVVRAGEDVFEPVPRSGEDRS